MTRLREKTVASLVMLDGSTHQVRSERHPARTYGRQFMILFTEAMELAATQIKQGMTLKILLLLPRHLSFTEFRQLRTIDLAAQLHTGKGSVSRALAQLLALGIVEKQGKGPRTAWRLSTDWGWNGTVDAWHAQRAGRTRSKKPAGGPQIEEQKSHNGYYGN